MALANVRFELKMIRSVELKSAALLRRGQVEGSTNIARQCPTQLCADNEESPVLLVCNVVSTEHLPRRLMCYIRRRQHWSYDGI